jgi:hypothetical protein
MRRRDALAALAAGALPVMAAPSPAGDEAAGVRFVRRCYEDIRSVKPGITRRELLKKFKQAGGRYNRKIASYSYLSCPYIKVSVTFEPATPGEVLSENDKVVTISTPYLDDPLSE